jgi:hypothetical protein
MQLSKSDYIAYLKHPALSFLKKRAKLSLLPIDPYTQAIFDTGNEFARYAEAQLKITTEKVELVSRGFV